MECRMEKPPKLKAQLITFVRKCWKFWPHSLFFQLIFNRYLVQCWTCWDKERGRRRRVSLRVSSVWTLKAAPSDQDPGVSTKLSLHISDGISTPTIIPSLSREVSSSQKLQCTKGRRTEISLLRWPLLGVGKGARCPVTDKEDRRR